MATHNSSSSHNHDVLNCSSRTILSRDMVPQEAPDSPIKRGPPVGAEHISRLSRAKKKKLRHRRRLEGEDALPLHLHQRVPRRGGHWPSRCGSHQSLRFHHRQTRKCMLPLLCSGHYQCKKNVSQTAHSLFKVVVSTRTFINFQINGRWNGLWNFMFTLVVYASSLALTMYATPWRFVVSHLYIHGSLITILTKFYWKPWNSNVGLWNYFPISWPYLSFFTRLGNTLSFTLTIAIRWAMVSTLKLIYKNHYTYWFVKLTVGIWIHYHIISNTQ